MTTITIVGLGPGDPGSLTKSVWDLLCAADELYVRTDQHPTLAALPASLAVHSFDAIYNTAEDFAAVYQRIAQEVIGLGSRPQGVIYAVPGDPAVGEATTWLIRDLAAARGLAVRVLNGVSFVEPACLALGLDPLERDGLQIVDAMVAAASHAPPFDTSRPALLAQCYSRALASDVKLTLLHSYDDQHPLTVLTAAGTAQQALRVVPLFELDRSADFDHLTTLYVPPAAPLGDYSRLQEIVAHLRAPDGCPWDLEQTLQTLRKDLLEESYELLEALDADDDAKIGEELGDAALVLAMLAQIAAEEERFRWPQVMEQICQKLIRRHPHVFGDVEVASVDEVLANWARIKEEEAGGKLQEAGGKPPSVLDSVPRALPALALASKYQSRLGRAGITPDLSGADVFGVALWQLVAEARAADVDAETALREVCLSVAGAMG
ncbi:MAG TPA: MazG family protein [Anaerolineae bacterium]|nr:MazG family protein [Anaerolineae bacterium]